MLGIEVDPLDIFVCVDSTSGTNSEILFDLLAELMEMMKMSAGGKVEAPRLGLP